MARVCFIEELLDCKIELQQCLQSSNDEAILFLFDGTSRSKCGTRLGEFQLGLKFGSAHQAEILLQIHAQLQPGRKTKISMTEKIYCGCENIVDAHARGPFSARAEKVIADYMHFSARLTGLKILAWFQKPGYDFQPGLNLPHVIATFILREFLSEHELWSQPG